MFLKNKMVVGFELNNEYSQLSFCAFDQTMPDTLSLVNGAEEYNIPTALLVRENDGSFSVGKDIRIKARETGNTLIDNLFNRIEDDENVTIGDKTYTASELFQIYIKKCLSFLSTIGRREEIVAISFNTSNLTQKFMDTIRLSITEVPVYFISKQECFYQYMLHQPEEIRLHDCFLFELDNREMKTLRLSFNRKTKPMVGMIEESDYIISGNDAEEKDTAFETIIKELSENRYISSSFLIGDGFSKEWCKSSLKELCKKGRAFQGNNLYSKGACYYAREKINPSGLMTDYLFLGEDKLKINVGMNVNDRGKEKYLPLLNAGTNWYEAKFEQDFMLSQDNKMTLLITSLNGGEMQTTDITLEYFDIRKNNTNRIHFALGMKEKNIMHIEVKDLGFGDIFPSKGTVWKDDIKV